MVFKNKCDPLEAWFFRINIIIPATSKQGIIGLLSQKNTRRYYISQCFEDLRHARIPISCVQYVVCGRK